MNQLQIQLLLLTMIIDVDVTASLVPENIDIYEIHISSGISR